MPAWTLLVSTVASTPAAHDQRDTGMPACEHGDAGDGVRVAGVQNNQVDAGSDEVAIWAFCLVGLKGVPLFDLDIRLIFMASNSTP